VHVIEYKYTIWRCNQIRAEGVLLILNVYISLEEESGMNVTNFNLPKPETKEQYNP
jgi:hypothetical protein